MIARDALGTQTRTWAAASHTDRLARSLAPLPALLLVWWLVTAPLSDALWLGLIAYSGVHLALLWAAPRRERGAARLLTAWLAIVVDALLGALLLLAGQALGAAFYPVFALITLRALAGYQQTPAATVIPFLLGPAYLYSARILGDTFSNLFVVDQLGGWLLLVGSLGFGATAIIASVYQQRAILRLQRELRSERGVREARVEELERMAAELRARMRERHALEEGLRAITSTLSLDDVLSQIVDSTVQTFGAGRVQTVVLSLETDGRLADRVYTQGAEDDVAWTTSLARRVMEQQVPAVIADAALDADLAAMAGPSLRSVLCVPLFVGDGPPRGALTVVGTTFAAFSSSDARHLSAFAAQAGIAIGNAELHSRLRRQQRLLEAVMRDIADGLLVFDEASQVLLANPVGRALLGAESGGRPIVERLRELSAVAAAGEGPALAPELRIGDEEETQRVFQAFASRVRVGEGAPDLTAIVLHDITDQKAEERARMDFISMVSHELRNPLHTLNGFVKIVLQGRAGALTPMQEEFLTMADGQIESLKGRIAELLEYNRFKAGRLALHPAPASLTRLASETIGRLALQAEQSSITLHNRVDELPLCQIDAPRIGQVLTNLVENAIKATPAGGTITVSAEQHDAEIWVRVADTGVGIPASDLGRIFHRFYQVAKHRRSTGNNLGLGLAICQQIVEGHGGRIWVESEEGVGTTFTFALPVTQVAELALA